jgi:hypothetical protein
MEGEFDSVEKSWSAMQVGSVNPDAPDTAMVPFSMTDETTGSATETFSLTLAHWREFGCPEVITVEVTPGDWRDAEEYEE